METQPALQEEEKNNSDAETHGQDKKRQVRPGQTQAAMRVVAIQAATDSLDENGCCAGKVEPRGTDTYLD